MTGGDVSRGRGKRFGPAVGALTVAAQPGDAPPGQPVRRVPETFGHGRVEAPHHGDASFGAAVRARPGELRHTVRSDPVDLGPFGPGTARHRHGEHGVAEDVDGTAFERSPGRSGHRVPSLLERRDEPGEFGRVRALVPRLLPRQPTHQVLAGDAAGVDAQELPSGGPEHGGATGDGDDPGAGSESTAGHGFLRS